MSVDEDLAERVLSKIDQQDVLSLAKNLIRIPSFTTEETKCARFLYDYFKKKSFSVELQRVERDRFQTIATSRGKGEGPTLMFNGHIDIDPLGAGWTRDPWKPVIEDDRLYGAGIMNMKAGVTAMIKAAEALKRAKVKMSGDLKIACVAGELQGGVGTVHLLKSGTRANMAVVTEPYGAHNIITTHAGVVEFAIHTYGVSEHISEIEHGVSAIDEMYKVIQMLKKLKFTHQAFPRLQGLPILLVGSIIGGCGRNYESRAPYLVPDVCTILVDLRTVPGMTLDTVRHDLVNALEELRKDDPTLRYEIELPPKPEREIDRVAMLPTDVPVDSAIVQSIIRSHKRIVGRDMDNVGTVYPLSYAGNDTAHLWEAGIPCCLYGPGGQFMPEQFVPIEELMTCTKVLALTALDICGHTSPMRKR